jgi:aminoglycoside phosphotransferase (APT) family kinase protein
MPIDPASLDEVGEALLAHVSTRLGASVSFAETPERIGRGFDTYIYAFRLQGEAIDLAWARPLVLRLYPAAKQADKAEREAAVQRFAVERGYPAPLPLAVERQSAEFGLPIMLLERVQGVPMLDLVGANPLRVGRLLASMAEGHVALHRLPIDGCPLPNDRPHVERKLEDIRPKVAAAEDEEFARGLRWLDEHKDVVMQEEQSLCHGDFHPLNIMVGSDGALTVLDWPDAAIGDRHCDVARTLVVFHIAWIAAENRLEKLALRYGRGFLTSRYLKPYRRLLPVDAARLRYWQALHAFEGWLLVTELGDPQPPAEARPDAVQRIPSGLADELRRYFWARTRSPALKEGAG